MPLWSPQPMWQGQDAYVIGGGSSLSTFDWDLLRGKNTIGCNSAFKLGHQICGITIFGDRIWWDKIGFEGTQSYGGLVVGCHPRITHDKTPWLLTMERNNVRELGTKKLIWIGNTGGAAINLALILGAQRVFLLGFDMKLGPGFQKYKNNNKEGKSPGRANWHDLRYEPSKKQPYIRFLKEFKDLARSRSRVYPDREIINVTDDSDLDYFPKVSLEEHFGKKEVNDGCSTLDVR